MKWDQHCWDRKLKSLNWTKKNQATSILTNQWKFNPPMVAWWEQLVQIMKKLLRTVPVKSVCQYEELLTILHDNEAAINS